MLYTPRFRRPSAAALLFVIQSMACGDDSTIPTGPTATGTGAADSGGGGEGMGGSGASGGGGAGGFDGAEEKKVIYQLVVRLFGNTNETRATDGTLAENGSGKFADIDETAIEQIRALGVTHIWLTGVLRQATLTDYASIGMPADDGDVVKGRAGSFYAVRDYYDVCPDYAEDPEARMAEFEALVDRIHAAGLKVMIDLVPNHVARGYGSVVKPEQDFGASDDKTVFFDPQNNFFYLPEPAGQTLALQKPAGWNPAGVTFDGAFGPEDGSPGNVPRATGNNVTSATPGATDWYETVKLNYGFNFADPGVSLYDPIPDTWLKVQDILTYWQDKGVDGFRVDFAHYVPTEAWGTILANAKAHKPDTYFVAEAYENLQGLLGAGFDSVYLDAAVDTLKRVYLGAASMDDVDGLFGSFDDPVRGLYLTYLENHDERRIASPIVPGQNPDDTGFGSTAAGRQLAPLLYLYSNGPILMLNGQEVGEAGAGIEGFGGDDGRTTIFDYWSMPAMVRWVNGHAYDGGLSTPEEVALRAYYRDLLSLTQAPEVRGNRYWGLRYLNVPGAQPDANGSLYPFARFANGGGSVLVIVANFGVGTASSGPIRLPEELLTAAGLPDEELAVTLVLDEGGLKNADAGTVTRAALAGQGFAATVGDQATNVYRIAAP